MIDVRENILARIEAVLDLIDPPTLKCHRNRTDLPESIRPCLVLFDDDEEAEQHDLARSGLAFRRVRMSPQILALLGATDGVGTALNALRAKIIYALTNDSILKGMTLNGDDIVYEGAQSTLQEGRRIEGALALRFSLTYLLRPSDLAP